MDAELLDKAVKEYKDKAAAFAIKYREEGMRENAAVAQYNIMLVEACKNAGLQVEAVPAEIVYQGMVFDESDITPDKLAELMRDPGNLGAKVGSKYVSFDRWGYVGSLLNDKGTVIKDCLDQVGIERALDFLGNDKDKGDH